MPVPFGKNLSPIKLIALVAGEPNDYPIRKQKQQKPTSTTTSNTEEDAIQLLRLEMNKHFADLNQKLDDLVAATADANKANLH
jgi:hypothetical protein